ncbi:sigma-54-dependent Fis family transcriptional regulator [Benzoatithermus flavus]|uniref:Sigma-54-dependent Fis family transcriptional regulator n=1 Tax=Benzoatithermus flavus TaxID=3108223 RepID=A0ABU8XTM0_9PROT
MRAPLKEQLFSVPENDRTIMSYWEKFMAGGGERPPLVRSIIDQSWQRCQRGKVDHGRHQAPPPMPEERLRELQNQCRDLIDASTPVMALARDFLLETGTVMVLTDANGIVLSMEGDRSLSLSNAIEAIHLLPGADWSELTCGTNAIGTALQTNLPIQVHSTEHFCFGIKQWSCSASIIRDPFDQSILGVIDISGLRGSYSRHSMALVVAAASRIENHFAQIEMEYRYRLLERCLWEAPRGMGDHVVVLDRHGRAIKANGDIDAVLRDLAAAASEHGLLAPCASGRARGRRLDRIDWAPEEWLTPVFDGSERLGAILVAPKRGAAARPRPRPASPLADAAPSQPFAEIIGDDPQLRQTVSKARRVAATTAPVLLLGETGVGKELFARSIHEASDHASGPFIALNCGGLPRDLLASELFGYAEGSFTGARKGGMIGKIEAADGGTLFLDEIGEMPIDLQPLFLRVLEQREVCRIGEVKARRVNFRLVAATNRDLRAEVEKHRFRADLFYRISVVSITIPSLRERAAEIPRLVEHFSRQISQRYGLRPARFSTSALQRLMAHDWPGNVRELRNVVESVLLTATDDPITEADLPPELSGAFEHRSALDRSNAGLTPIEVAEREEIRRALQDCRGNVTAAARELGIAKSTVYAKMKRYGLGRRMLEPTA